MTTVINGFTRAVRGLMTSNIIIFVLSQNLLGVVCPVCLIPSRMFNYLIHLLTFSSGAFTEQGLPHHNVQGLRSKYEEISEWFHNEIIHPQFCVAVKHGSTCLIPPVLGFDLFASPIHSYPNVQNSNLPGSCIFVSTSLQAEHPDILYANLLKLHVFI